VLKQRVNFVPGDTRILCLGVQYWRRTSLLGGALSVLFGLLLAFLPGVGLLSLTWLIGIYALIFGVAFIVLGFRVRGHGTASRVS
jgi:uncharacterized membrane protein HdeD (DUF308 family)